MYSSFFNILLDEGIYMKNNEIMVLEIFMNILENSVSVSESNENNDKG
jgi:hypothetical protein